MDDCSWTELALFSITVKGELFCGMPIGLALESDADTVRCSITDMVSWERMDQERRHS
jgi:hypothetical protein